MVQKNHGDLYHDIVLIYDKIMSIKTAMEKARWIKSL
jgi:hypothetical protein